MPSGVFKPYAGVSTAIIVFGKTNAGGTEKVWFYDMKSDGFSLDDKRVALGNDGDISDIVARFHNLEGETDRKRTEQSFLVDKEEIKENDYDLSINRYKEIEYEKIEYEEPWVIMARLDELAIDLSSKREELRGLLDE
ncbi:MAG: N-6 DNA Methylase [Firmicutes bacterium ADurb.Bin419]|nr:MAG: N-6 DNA Methylase [Firmicutes bacterium ADurb.Bin419]